MLWKLYHPLTTNENHCVFLRKIIKMANYIDNMVNVKSVHTALIPNYIISPGLDC